MVEVIEKNRDIALSNIDMDRMLKEIDERGLNWIKSSNIKSNLTVKDLFGNYGHVVIWHPWDKNNAHWVVLLRNKKGQYYYFDSFGEKHDIIKEKELIDILKRGNAKEFYANDITLQKDESAVCGRYCILMIALNKIYEGDFNKIDDWVKNFKKTSKNHDRDIAKLIYG